MESQGEQLPARLMEPARGIAFPAGRTVGNNLEPGNESSGSFFAMAVSALHCAELSEMEDFGRRKSDRKECQWQDRKVW